MGGLIYQVKIDQDYVGVPSTIPPCQTRQNEAPYLRWQSMEAFVQIIGCLFLCLVSFSVL